MATIAYRKKSVCIALRPDEAETILDGATTWMDLSKYCEGVSLLLIPAGAYTEVIPPEGYGPFPTVLSLSKDLLEDAIEAPRMMGQLPNGKELVLRVTNNPNNAFDKSIITDSHIIDRPL